MSGLPKISLLPRFTFALSHIVWVVGWLAFPTPSCANRKKNIVVVDRSPLLNPCLVVVLLLLFLHIDEEGRRTNAQDSLAQQRETDQRRRKPKTKQSTACLSRDPSAILARTPCALIDDRQAASKLPASIVYLPFSPPLLPSGLACALLLAAAPVQAQAIKNQNRFLPRDHRRPCQHASKACVYMCRSFPPPKVNHHCSNNAKKKKEKKT